MRALAAATPSAGLRILGTMTRRTPQRSSVELKSPVRTLPGGDHRALIAELLIPH
jgi:hypothetical protein